MRQLEKTVRTRKRFDEEAIEKKARQSKRQKPVRGRVEQPQE